MNTESARAQIEAIRCLLKGIEAGLDGWEIEKPCQHPKDERIDLSTMGHEAWQCSICGYTFGMEEGE